MSQTKRVCKALEDNMETSNDATVLHVFQTGHQLNDFQALPELVSEMRKKSQTEVANPHSLNRGYFLSGPL